MEKLVGKAKAHEELKRQLRAINEQVKELKKFASGHDLIIVAHRRQPGWLIPMGQYHAEDGREVWMDSSGCSEIGQSDKTIERYYDRA